MLKSRMFIILIIELLSAGDIRSFAQTVPPKEQEAKLIAVLKSDASQKEKADACRQLAVIGTKDAIAPLAALLGDEKLSHMARYALETIPDTAVDEALRDALGKLKGRPLVGVIGSIGVRRDAQAVKALAKMLQDSDTEVAQAAARALGKIGNSAAAKALQAALPNAPSANQLALCEGLFRCAEALAAEGRPEIAIEIYDQLRSLKAPHQVRGGALRGAILDRGKEGLPLLRQYLSSDDYILFSAAVQTAGELPYAEVTEALTAVLKGLSADNQILIIQVLGKRADPEALPALFALTKSGEKSVRLAAIRALPEIGHPSAVPVLVGLLADADRQISEAAQEGLAALPGQEADAVVMAMLNSSQTAQRLVALELIGRRRMTTSIPALLKAARDADPQVRSAAIKMVGELGGPAELPALLDLFMGLEQSQELAAAEQALIAVLAGADNPQSHAEKFTSLLTQATGVQKSSLFRVLGTVGGSDALRAVCTWVGDSDAQVNTAAIRALCAWKDADAAPILLRLAEKFRNPNDKTLCLRGYLGFAARRDLPASQRLSMCHQAAGLIQRDDERKLLLSALATVPALEALSMAETHLDNPATKEEACLAVVSISEQIVEQKSTEVIPDQVRDALQKVLQATDNKDVISRARAILKKVGVPTTRTSQSRKRGPKRTAGK